MSAADRTALAEIIAVSGPAMPSDYATADLIIAAGWTPPTGASDERKAFSEWREAFDKWRDTDGDPRRALLAAGWPSEADVEWAQDAALDAGDGVWLNDECLTLDAVRAALIAALTEEPTK